MINRKEYSIFYSCIFKTLSMNFIHDSSIIFTLSICRHRFKVPLSQSTGLLHK